MMTTDTSPQSEQVVDPTLVEFAAELRRLANDLLRDMRRGTTLPGLSHLVAMRPLHDMLMRSLSERVTGNAPVHPSGDNETEPNAMPGYL